jgi:hypothetical protein
MNITFYKNKIRKLRKQIKSGKSKYSNTTLENRIIKCKNKIIKLRKLKPKTKRPFRTR